MPRDPHHDTPPHPNPFATYHSVQCLGRGAPQWSCYGGDPGTAGTTPTRTSPTG